MSSNTLSKKDQLKTVFLSSLGGGLEFYDFVVFAVFAASIGHTFFPVKSPSARLVGAYAVFAIGYLARPIGGLIFSHFGDKYGRKNTFSFSISVMAFSTLLMAFVPSYENGGIACSLLFVFFRVIQGMSIGGEIPGAITFVSEHIRERPGAACAIIFLFLKFGVLLADGIYVLLHMLLDEKHLMLYGWRMAFILGGGIAIVSYYLRKDLLETNQFITHKNHHAIPFLALIKQYPKQICQGFFITGLNATMFSLYLLYLTAYMQEFLSFSTEKASILSLYQVILLGFGVPIFGILSDRLGRPFLLRVSAVLVLLSSPLFFYLLKHDLWLYPLFTLNAIIFSMYNGAFPCLISELFPVDVRFSGVAFSYNMAFALFGGLSPLIVSLIIQKTHYLLSPALVIMGSCLLSLFALWFVRPYKL